MSDGKHSKSISATRQEWEEIDLESRMHGMSRSQYLLKIWRCYQKGEAMHTQEEDVVRRSLVEATELLGKAMQSIDRRIENQTKATMGETTEAKKMIRQVREPKTKPPMDIEPQKNKPSLDEVLAYIKDQKQCTNIDIAKHFDAKPAYIKIVVPTDHPELTVRSSEGVMTYCTGDTQ